MHHRLLRATAWVPWVVLAMVAFPATAAGSDSPVTAAHGTPGDDSNVRPPVTETDLLIIRRANEILGSEDVWNRHDDRVLHPGATTFSLYTAIAQATFDVLGTFAHRGAVMQEARFAIQEIAPDRKYEHRLMGYNNDPTTTFADIKRVLALTEGRVARRLAESASSPLPPEQRYLGQPVPGLTPERFAPGMVCTGAVELNAVFSADGREFYFTRLVGGVDTDTMHVIKFADGKWGRARELLLFPNRARAESADMFLSPDDNEMYFLARFLNPVTGEKPNYDIWLSRRVNGDWATAELVPPPISTPADELYPVFGPDGSLYVSSSRPGGIGECDIYRAPRGPDGTFGAPENLGSPINIEHGTGSDMCIAPDGSYLIMTPQRPDGQGRGDLHVSHRLPDGKWGELINLGDTVNTANHEWCPMVTPDGKYLFFSRWFGETWETATDGEVYWVDIRILDQFRDRKASGGQPPRL